MPVTTKDPVVFIGTYTQKEGSQSKGIYIYRMDASSGELTFAGEAPGVLNPSYLAIHPTQRFLYAANEVQMFGGQEGGGVSAFSINPTSGELHLLNAHSSAGKDPCYISIDRTGRFALVANYSSGNIAMFPIQPDGQLGSAAAVIQHNGSSIDPVRQDKPYAHCILPDPANHFVFATDLGADKLLIYELDLTEGTLSPHREINIRPGAGPRHVIFHPNAPYLYLINELNSTLVVYRYDGQSGNVEEIQTISTLPEGHAGQNLCADLHISGRYLYASNRGHDTIAWYALDPDTGQLTYQGEVSSGGKYPRNFAIDPDGSFLLAANEQSNNIVVFRIDGITGGLSQTGYEVELSYPVCLKFMYLE